MTKIDDGGPAFPNKDAFGNMIPGMSLRAWLAGQALTGIQAFLYGAAKDGALKTDVDDRTVAKCACAIADAVIAALKGGANE